MRQVLDVVAAWKAKGIDKPTPDVDNTHIRMALPGVNLAYCIFCILFD